MNSNLNSLNQSQKDIRAMLSEWRSKNFHEVELPLSKRVFHVRDVGIMDLAVKGQIPNTLMDLVILFNENKVSEVELMKNHIQEFGELLNLVMKACIVLPPIADEADDDHLGLNEIVEGDKVAIFNFVNRESNMVRPFRSGDKKPVEGLQPG